jgi:acetolactate synthase-1/2/3 large subunit
MSNKHIDRRAFLKGAAVTAAEMAALHNRRMDTAAIGTVIEKPNIDFAKLAQSQGVWAEGPISDPSKIGAALSRAVAVVKKGEPALVDVVCQGR